MSRRSIISSLVATALVLVLLVLNISVYAFTIEKNTYIDMTTEGLYTLSDAMREEIKDIEGDITITFCMDVDQLLSNHDTRYVYIMAKEIEKVLDNVTVETVNTSKNPTAVQKYKTTSATKINRGDVIVSCGDRFRIIGSQSFWSYDSTGEKYWAFNGEYKMATAMLSVASKDEYTAYFTVGHGETVYDEQNPDESHPTYYFYHLLRDCGLKVKTLNLDTDEIPEDCVLLIFNGPTEDYTSMPDGNMNVNYTSPMEKVDRYLDKFGSVMVFADPFVCLPELEEYLCEWGMEINHAQIKDALNTLDGELAESERTTLATSYANLDEHPIGYSLYSDIIDLAGTPKTIIENSGYIKGIWRTPEVSNSRSRTSMYSAVLLSSPTSSAYNEQGLLTSRDGSYHLASVTARVHTKEVSRYYSYMFVAASTSLTSSKYLSNGTYANYDLMFAIVRTISRTDVYASDSLGALTMNTANYGGKILESDAMSQTEKQIYENQKVVKTYAAMTAEDAITFTVLILIVPAIIIPALCVLVTSRRKYL